MKHNPTRNEQCTAFLAHHGITIPAGTELSVRCKREGEPQNDKGTAFTDGSVEWSNFRIDTPEKGNWRQQWSIWEKADAIGSTLRLVTRQPPSRRRDWPVGTLAGEALRTYVDSDGLQTCAGLRRFAQVCAGWVRKPAQP
jgi:hypothetical protein